MTLRILEFGRDRAVPIEVYSSQAAASVPLGSGQGAARVYALHFDPGGSIGRHRAGFGQLFVVVSGSGWVEGDDGTRTELAPGQAAWFARGEMHAKGSESGGRVGEETAFVLLQRLIHAVDLPIYVQGAIGLHSAAACLAGGAAGVVLDSQLALLRESSLPRAPASALRAA